MGPSGLSGWERSAKAALVILVAVAAGVAGCIAIGLTDENPEVTVGDLTLRGGIVGSVEADEYAGVATLTYTGDGAAEWELYRADGTYLVETGDGTYARRGYEDAGSGRTLTVDEPGTYGVRLYVDGGLEASGTMVLDGDVTRTYTWTQSIWRGETYEYAIEFTYLYSDYARYADADVDRHENGESDARFVAVDDCMLTLESLLRAEYLEVRGGSAPAYGQEYADYLLSFVQCCIGYPVSTSASGDSYVVDPEDGYGDLTLYGQIEYWAYPMETIHQGYGDCEDTSFLAAALFSAAGYTAGVVTLPNHMVAAVALDEFSPVSYPEIVVSLTAVTDGDMVLYYCETTVDSSIACGYLDVETSQTAIRDGELYLVSRSRRRRRDPAGRMGDRVPYADVPAQRHGHQVPGGDGRHPRGRLGHGRLFVGAGPYHDYAQVYEHRQLRPHPLDERHGVVCAQVILNPVAHGRGDRQEEHAGAPVLVGDGVGVLRVAHVGQRPVVGVEHEPDVGRVAVDRPVDIDPHAVHVQDVPGPEHPDGLRAREVVPR